MNTNLTTNGRNNAYAGSFNSGRNVQQAGRAGAPAPSEHTEPTPPGTVQPIQKGTTDKHYDTDPSARPNLGAVGDTHAKASSGI